MKEELIAPCGMNCRLCYAFQREKNKCFGCLANDQSLPNSCRRCIKKKCCHEKGFRFCYECDKFPCKSLKQLDKRYCVKYHMSMIENLKKISNDGIKKFLKIEDKKWRCSNCNEIICVHRNACSNCSGKYFFD